MEDERIIAANKPQTEDAVLGELRFKEQRPSDLLENLSSKGYTTLEVKQALAQLLDDARIELTTRRILRTR